jgi:hypothetical protein
MSRSSFIACAWGGKKLTVTSPDAYAHQRDLRGSRDFFTILANN